MTTPRHIAAYSIHLFTASGLIFAFLALVATLEDRPLAAFAYLAVTLVIDGVDGTLARWVNVTVYGRRILGDNLDLAVDYLTYALIPALMVWHWDLVPAGWQTGTAIAMLLGSAYTVSNTSEKSADGYFIGFPGVWNLVIFVVLILGLGAWETLAILGLCLVLTFVPLAYCHPFRVAFLRPLTLAVAGLWSLCAAALAWQVFAQDRGAVEAPLALAGLVGASLYFGALTLMRTLRPPKTA